MVRNVTGTISRLSQKTFDDGNTGYSFQLEGSNQWFRNGRTPVPAGVGQQVKFVADEKNAVQRGTMQATEAVVQTAPTPVAATSVAGPSTKAPVSTNVGQSREGYWDAKEARDIAKDARFEAQDKPRMALSVAVQAAAQVVCKALDKDAIGFGNAAKAKKLGILSAYVKEVALELAVFIQDAPNQLASYKSNSGQAVGAEVAEDEVQE